MIQDHPRSSKKRILLVSNSSKAENCLANCGKTGHGESDWKNLKMEVLSLGEPSNIIELLWICFSANQVWLPEDISVTWRYWTPRNISCIPALYQMWLLQIYWPRCDKDLCGRSSTAAMPLCVKIRCSTLCWSVLKKNWFVAITLENHELTSINTNYHL